MNWNTENDFFPVIRKERKVQTMIQHKVDGVEYLTFHNLEQLSDFSHLFSTRIGGVSNGIFSSMNLSFTRGDEKDAVLENFSRIAKILGISTKQFVLSDQTHTDHIHVVTKEDAGNGLIKPLPYHDIDGLITNVPGVALSTF